MSLYVSLEFNIVFKILLMVEVNRSRVKMINIILFIMTRFPNTSTGHSYRTEIEPEQASYTVRSLVEPGELPQYYDTRIAYPECQTISSIKNQSNCGSCWAVAVASAFSDRLCIHSKGAINYDMSAGHLISCFKKGQGCWGGSPYLAWKYIEEHGLVTGGDYGSKQVISTFESARLGCHPYPIKPKSIYLSWIFALTPACPKKPCDIIHKAKHVQPIEPNEYDIRKEIYQNGPVTAIMKMYLSFFFYSKGIYNTRMIDLPLVVGNHVIRILGWGETDGQKYWIIANSFGTEWGENGIFKLPRGKNYLGIESRVTSGLPDFA